MTVTVNFTETFYHTAEQVIDHLADFREETAVIEDVEQLIHWFEDAVSTHPERFKVCSDLAKFGIYLYREAIYGKFRLLYSIDKSSGQIRITGEILLRTNMDIREHLVEHCLLYR